MALLNDEIDRDRVAIGDAVTFTFTLAAPQGSDTVECIVDYLVHYQGANGLQRRSARDDVAGCLR